jgi:hypothetical protein
MYRICLRVNINNTHIKLESPYVRLPYMKWGGGGEGNAHSKTKEGACPEAQVSIVVGVSRPMTSDLANRRRARHTTPCYNHHQHGHPSIKA